MAASSGVLSRAPLWLAAMVAEDSEQSTEQGCVIESDGTDSSTDSQICETGEPRRWCGQALPVVASTGPGPGEEHRSASGGSEVRAADHAQILRVYPCLGTVWIRRGDAEPTSIFFRTRLIWGLTTARASSSSTSYPRAPARSRHETKTSG